MAPNPMSSTSGWIGRCAEMIPGQLWTLKDLFVLPNEYIYWSIQIVMYPFMTGLVAGSFVLSSLYHVFGIKQLKGIASFALVLCFALLPAAMVPLMLHLQNPLRGINVLMTPHFTSAIAAFGVVFSTYFAIVSSELWFLYRKHFVEQSLSLKKKPHKTLTERLLYPIFTVLTLGSFDISQQARRKDEKAIKVLATAGIPVALFLHGYAGFIFGSVKANALWMTPLMPRHQRRHPEGIRLDRPEDEACVAVQEQSDWNTRSREDLYRLLILAPGLLRDVE